MTVYVQQENLTQRGENFNQDYRNPVYNSEPKAEIYVPYLLSHKMGFFPL